MVVKYSKCSFVECSSCGVDSMFVFPRLVRSLMEWKKQGRRRRQLLLPCDCADAQEDAHKLGFASFLPPTV